MSEAFIGKGWAYPVHTDRSGGIALASGDEELAESIQLIIGTALGERPMRPEFGCGVHDYIFEAVDAYTVGRLEHEIREALERWEPRIEVLDVDFDFSGTERGELLIDIGYRLRATNDVRNLVYPFYVIPEEGSA